MNTPQQNYYESVTDTLMIGISIIPLISAVSFLTTVMKTGLYS
jgi:hypothetical protein